MFLLISLIILSLSFFLFRAVAGSMAFTKINLISWIFYYNLIIQSFIASVLIINNWDNHYIINTLEYDARLYGWIAVQYTMLAMPIGMLLAVYLHGLSSNRAIFYYYIHQPIQTTMSTNDSYIRYPLYLLSIIAVLSVFYTFAMLKTNPLIAVFSGFDAESLAGLRQDANRQFPGNIYIRNIFAIGLTPILAYMAFAYWKLTQSRKDFLWFLLMFVASFFIKTYDLSKAPFIFFVLGFLFLHVLIQGGVSKKLFLFFALIAMFLILLAYYLVMDDVVLRELFSYNTGIGGRIFLTQAAGTYFAFEHFPSSSSFIGFASFSSFISDSLGLPHSERAARIMMTIFHPASVEAGLAGVMNSLFIAEAWANFGWIGVIISPIYVGFIIQLLFMFFLKSKKTPIMLGLFTYFSGSLPITGGINDFFYNAGIVITIIIFTTAYIIGRLLRMTQGFECENNFSSPTAIKS